ncbi:MAG: Flp pilus assembly complex ATPase component TadA [Gammaproteobacteria bacterium]|nr:Flp pilus assembly complex ATPase component TadA [Gammaproteobacteria bacterium]MCP5135404.1 Flp pilus assembly complex ATPase component TadA [Gammaproteobacteria bacterium]
MAASPDASGNGRSSKLNTITDIDLNRDVAVVTTAEGTVTAIRYSAPEGSVYRDWYQRLMPSEQSNSGDQDFTVDLGDQRWRACVYGHHHGRSASLRALPTTMPELQSLGFEEDQLLSLCSGTGLVLFAGPTGAGKSSTMAAVIRSQLARGCLGKTITIEHPIEYDHGDPLIHQREVGTHVDSFAEGVRNALRQFPKTIVIGEIREPEAAAAAIDAGLSGHRVLATIHADSVRQAIERMWDRLDDQGDEMLPGALQGVVAQHLVRTPAGALPVWESLAIDDECRAVLSRGAEAINQLGYHQTRQRRPMLHECARQLMRDGVATELLSQWL